LGSSDSEVNTGAAMIIDLNELQNSKTIERTGRKEAEKEISLMMSGSLIVPKRPIHRVREFKLRTSSFQCRLRGLLNLYPNSPHQKAGGSRSAAMSSGASDDDALGADWVHFFTIGRDQCTNIAAILSTTRI